MTHRHVAYLAGFLGATAAAAAGAGIQAQTGRPGAALFAFVVAGAFLSLLLVPRLDAGKAAGPVPNTFRPSAGLLVTDGAGRVLALERRKVPGAWQLPQGGIDPGESAEAGAWRELQEETGLTASGVVLVRIAPRWIAYELPEAMRSAKTGRGQAQLWFLFRAAGAPLPAPGEEARAWAWKPMAEVLAEVAPFRRPVYEAVAELFAAELGGTAGR
ncbi:MAG: RNA pyrophosphohydrolase [Anaeromyxobacter sp.]